MAHAIRRQLCPFGLMVRDTNDALPCVTGSTSHPGWLSLGRMCDGPVAIRTSSEVAVLRKLINYPEYAHERLVLVVGFLRGIAGMISEGTGWWV